MLRRAWSPVKLNRRLAVLVAALSLILSTRSHATSLYSIQAGAYASAEEAQARQASLAQVCSPVFVQYVEDGSAHGHKVRVGRFSSYAQAWAYKSRLPDEFLPGAFLVSWASDTAEETPLKLPVERPFDPTGLDAPEPPEALSYWRAGGFAL
jgi:hypothetical protein